VLKTRKAIARMAIGGHLTVEATDPLSAIDIPLFAGKPGTRLSPANATAPCSASSYGGTPDRSADAALTQRVGTGCSPR
jgi:hypothetical protein